MDLPEQVSRDEVVSFQTRASLDRAGTELRNFSLKHSPLTDARPLNSPLLPMVRSLSRAGVYVNGDDSAMVSSPSEFNLDAPRLSRLDSSKVIISTISERNSAVNFEFLPIDAANSKNRSPPELSSRSSRKSPRIYSLRPSEILLPPPSVVRSVFDGESSGFDGGGAATPLARQSRWTWSSEQDDIAPVLRLQGQGKIRGAHFSTVGVATSPVRTAVETTATSPVSPPELQLDSQPTIAGRQARCLASLKRWSGAVAGPYFGTIILCGIVALFVFFQASTVRYCSMTSCCGDLKSPL